jgi:ankyrin repeat protein
MLKRRSLFEMFLKIEATSSNKKVRFVDDFIIYDYMMHDDRHHLKTLLSCDNLKIDMVNVNYFGKTILHEAIRNGLYDIVKLLIDKKVNINQSDVYQNTPLHEACYLGDYNITKLLLDNKADVNAVNYDGNRPYDLIHHQNLPLISLLLNYMTTETLVKNVKRKSSLKPLKRLKSRQITPSPSGSLKEYFEKNLSLILNSKNLNEDDIIEQINLLCPNDRHKKAKEFISVLTTLIFENCIDGTKNIIPKINTALLSKKLQILKHFVANNLDLELECLYTVQNLDFKLCNPIGFIRHFFDTLYYCKIIRKDAFIQWRKGKTPYRSLEDHAISILLLKDFFSF